MQPDLSLYIHIPFCRAKCHYCNFNSYGGLEELIPRYIKALAMGIERWGQALGAPGVDTIYFGGGTPSLLGGHQWQRLLEACASGFNVAEAAEVTAEANPGTVSAASLAEMRRLGVNRLSLGVQSFDDRELGELGRIHSAAEALKAFVIARAAGFDNVNLDLLYGLLRQSLADWRASLERGLSLAPEHISLYALTLEEGTPLERGVASGEVPRPDPDLAADMYLLAEDLLEKAGYEHYEISNWARPGRRCRHNLVYWHNCPYLGFGAGAHSYWGGYRFWTVASPAEYIAWTETADQVTGDLPRERPKTGVPRGRSPFGEGLGVSPQIQKHPLPARKGAGGWSKSLPPEDSVAQQIERLVPVEGMEAIDRRLELAETMILGLRLVEGVELEEMARRFGREAITACSCDIDEMVGLGLIEADGRRLRLSARGRLLGNEVFVRFLPGAR